jgi:CzcA family heavy metal efflux pump
LNRSIFIPCAVAVASLLGLIAARSIPSAIFPEIQFNRAIVMADSGDLPPDQMMVAVTRPLEEAAYGVAGVRLVRSTTTRGSSEIDVDFLEGGDPVADFQLLDSAIAEVRKNLPAGTGVDTRLLTSGTFPILDVSLSSRDRGLDQVSDVARYDLVPALHRIPGVFRVDTVGGKYREYFVRLDPARMLQHRLGPNDVVAGLARANLTASAGRVADAHRAVLTIVTTGLQDADQLAALPIANIAGQPVYVRDIASVEMGIHEDYVRTASENGPAVLVTVSRQADGNTVAIADAAHAVIRDFQTRYPDIQFSFSYDQAPLVRESIASVRDAILLGLVLAVVVVFLFTASLASAAVAALVVPCTIAITFVVMKGVGMTFNMMTLGGLAAGIGLFIDDAIVMVEGISRARDRGQDANESVVSALNELRRPLIASTATVVVVFAPLILLSGVTGVFFRALALTLGSGLFVSLLLALYFTPALELLVGPLRHPAREPGRIFVALREAYVAILRPFAWRPIFGPLLALLSIGGAFMLYRTIGTDYLPALDEGGFVLDYAVPPQSTLADTEMLVGKIEEVLRHTPEVAAFSRRTGTQLGFFLTESSRGDLSVRLRADRSRDIYAVMASVRQQIEATVPGVKIEFSQLLQDLIGDLSGTPEPIEVKVFGADQNAIENSARVIAKEVAKIPGMVDVFDGLVLSNPQEEVLVDETAAQRYALDAEEIQTVLRTVVEGTVATRLPIGDRLYDVLVRYPDEYQQDLGLLPTVLLKTADGGAVPLSAVATLRWLGEQSELDRERMRPVVRVTARVEGIDLGTAMARAKLRLAALPLPAGVSLEYGGLYSDQQKAFGQLALVLVAAIVAMFLVLLWEFGRLTPAVAIVLGAISSIAGSFIALELNSITLNLSSFMGLVMVAGITAKNGILLLDQAERGHASGSHPREALIEAARSRFRPILMTTLATVAGLLPLAMGLGAGARVQQPLALAVIGGLAFAMILSTPLTGGIYLLSFRRR